MRWGSGWKYTPTNVLELNYSKWYRGGETREEDTGNLRVRRGRGENVRLHTRLRISEMLSIIS